MNIPLIKLTCHTVGSRGWQSQSPTERKAKKKKAQKIMQKIGNYEEEATVTPLVLALHISEL